MKKIVNGQEFDLTPEEEAEFLARQAAWEAEELNRKKLEYQSLLQSIIDSKAQEKTYGNGLSCASYVNSTNPQWAAEAQAFISWRDDVYAYALNVLNQVQTGEIEAPSIPDFIKSLPTIRWPN